TMRRKMKMRRIKREGGLLPVEERNNNNNIRNRKSRAGVRRVEISSIIDVQLAEMSLQSHERASMLVLSWLLKIGGLSDGTAGCVRLYLAEAVSAIFCGWAGAHHRNCAAGAARRFGRRDRAPAAAGRCWPGPDDPTSDEQGQRAAGPGQSAGAVGSRW